MSGYAYFHGISGLSTRLGNDFIYQNIIILNNAFVLNWVLQNDYFTHNRTRDEKNTGCLKMQKCFYRSL